MKNKLALLMALAMIGSFNGCGNSSSSSSDAKSNTSSSDESESSSSEKATEADTESMVTTTTTATVTTTVTTTTTVAVTTTELVTTAIEIIDEEPEIEPEVSIDLAGQQVIGRWREYKWDDGTDVETYNTGYYYTFNADGTVDITTCDGESVMSTSWHMSGNNVYFDNTDWSRLKCDVSLVDGELVFYRSDLGIKYYCSKS